jgi:hypothetical protein
MRRTNWRPDYDLKVLIIRPYQPYVEQDGDGTRG